MTSMDVGATGSTDAFNGAGVVIGVVCDVNDEAGQGRVRLTFPFLGSDAPSNWAPIAAPMAGKDRGFFMVPEVGDEAVVLFERGDPSVPIVIGFTYNGVDATPSGAVRERMIRSFNGHTIRFIDSTPTAGGNRGGIAIEDAHGNAIVLTNGKVTIRSMGVLELDAATVVIKSCGVARIVSPTPNPI
jgi:uncharacterized protein involved in type VI secretion and phage assembly